MAALKRLWIDAMMVRPSMTQMASTRPAEEAGLLAVAYFEARGVNKKRARVRMNIAGTKVKRIETRMIGSRSPVRTLAKWIVRAL